MSMVYFQLLFLFVIVFSTGCDRKSTASSRQSATPPFVLPVSPSFNLEPVFTIMLSNPVDGSILGLHEGAGCAGTSMGMVRVSGTTEENYTITSSALSAPGDYNYYVSYTSGNTTLCSSRVEYRLIGEPVLSFSSPSFSPKPAVSVSIGNMMEGELTLHLGAGCTGSSVGSATIDSNATGVISITGDALSVAGSQFYSAKYQIGAGMNGDSRCSGVAEYVLSTPDPIIKTPSYKSGITGGNFVLANRVYPGSNADFTVHVASDLLTEDSTVKLYSDAACSTFLEEKITPSGRAVDFTINKTTEGDYSYYAKEVSATSEDISLCSSAVTYKLFAPILQLTTSSPSDAMAMEITVLDFTNIDPLPSGTVLPPGVSGDNELTIYYQPSTDLTSAPCSKDFLAFRGSGDTAVKADASISIDIPTATTGFGLLKDVNDIYRIWVEHKAPYGSSIKVKDCFFSGIVFEDYDVSTAQQ